MVTHAAGTHERRWCHLAQCAHKSANNAAIGKHGLPAIRPLGQQTPKAWNADVLRRYACDTSVARTQGGLGNYLGHGQTPLHGLKGQRQTNARGPNSSMRLASWAQASTCWPSCAARCPTPPATCNKKGSDTDGRRDLHAYANISKSGLMRIQAPLRANDNSAIWLAVHERKRA